MPRALLLACALACLAANAAAQKAHLPRPYALEPQVRFWTRIYSEIDTKGGLIHDSEHLDVIYEVLRLPDHLSPRAQQAHIDAVKQKYRDVLLGLAAGKREGLSPLEKRVLRLWPTAVTAETLGAAADRVRFQLGQADRFRAGIVRSGAWEPHIREVLESHGLPPELAALPHVESSFNPQAYSHAGAAGLWQFTRSTGKQFLRIDDVVDERLDPHLATVAAARLLAENHRKTAAWPLAITAYNHGTSGVLRAVATVGSRDIDVLVRRYRSPSFGFASRNFYTEFLAALEVETHAERYFGPLRKDEPTDHVEVVLDRHYSVQTLQRTLGVDLETLRTHNLALRPPFWTGRRSAPSGYVLRVPRSSAGARDPSLALARAGAGERAASAASGEKSYRVKRGDSISLLARRFGVREDDLLDANGLRSARQLRAGQLLRIPGKQAAPATRVAAAEPPAPRPDASAATPTASPAEAAPGEAAPSEAAPAAASATLASAVDARPEPPAEIPAGARIAAAPRAEAPVAASPNAASPLAAAPTAEAPSAEASAPAPAVAPPVPPAPGAIELAADGPARPPTRNDAPSPPPEAAAPAPAPAPAGLELPAGAERYAVAGKGTIVVQPEETLGHYSRWLEVPPARLRALNRMGPRGPLVTGRRFRLDFSRVPRERFEEQRLAYHRELQRQFFDVFEVAGTEQHVLRRGDTLWGLSRGAAAVPVWLLHHYNPDLEDFAQLRPGALITIPRIERRQS